MNHGTAVALGDLPEGWREAHLDLRGGEMRLEQGIIRKRSLIHLEGLMFHSQLSKCKLGQTKSMTFLYVRVIVQPLRLAQGVPLLRQVPRPSDGAQEQVQVRAVQQDVRRARQVHQARGERAQEGTRREELQVPHLREGFRVPQEPGMDDD